MAKELLLAFEGGGTKTRILVAGTDGNILAREVGGPSSSLYIDPPAYLRSMSTLLARVRRFVDSLPGAVTRVGMGGPMDPGLVRRLLQQAFGQVAVDTFGEAQIALALYGLEWGISLVAGTGSSCRFVNARGDGFASGGFGPQYGDEGSAYWIARQAFTAAAHAVDGRGPDTAVRQRLCAFFGISNLCEIYPLCGRTGHLPAPQMARFAPEVVETARHGDKVARSILHSAGRELAKLIVVTAKKSGAQARPMPVVLTGGVFNAGRLVTGPLKRGLQHPEYTFDVYPEVPEPTEGIIKALLAQSKRGRKHVP